MQLKDLAPVLRSPRGRIQFAIVYDLGIHNDIEGGCSVEYAVKHYGEWRVDRITAEDDYLVLHVREEV